MRATAEVKTLVVEGLWTLPPLILHPFSAEDTAETLLEGSKASLILNGLAPDAGQDREWLKDAVLRSRVQEVRMLYFLGKDLHRWIEQCMDFVCRTSELKRLGIQEQSFAALIVEAPPHAITEKLALWGVSDRRSVFSRAIGVKSAFNTPPGTQTVSTLFLNNYHRFVDYLYVCFQSLEPFTEIHNRNFVIEMFASAEYTSMLARQWADDEI